MNNINKLQSLEERTKEMAKKKKKNLEKMKRLKRSYVKAKLEKRKINAEIKLLQAEWQERIKNRPEEAKTAFAQELKNVTAEDMFPKDLEDEFDKIELRNIKQGRVLQTEDLSNDADLKQKGVTDVAEVLERELNEELADHNTAPVTREATEIDDETRAQLESEAPGIGLTDGDIFIDEDGNEKELEPDDEEK